MSEFASDQFWEALEARQDELIARLDALNASIEAALAELDETPADASHQKAA